jgi:hypothetical protein
VYVAEARQGTICQLCYNRLAADWHDTIPGELERLFDIYDDSSYIARGEEALDQYL